MKESSKNNVDEEYMSRSCGKWEMKNWKENRFPESTGEMEAGKKTDIAMEDFIKSDVERTREKLKRL